ncbi:hypothetical protein BYT27DRAFT_6788105 [Phlegmacium glaucopus]|nr:hypothetical protein BYT27DRAFT_6788105 [Phlegmacium glaucopus]
MFKFIGYNKPGMFIMCLFLFFFLHFFIYYSPGFKISEPTGHPILINWFSFCKATNCWVWYCICYHSGVFISLMFTSHLESI